jgi:hypothetical protein
LRAVIFDPAAADTDSSPNLAVVSFQAHCRKSIHRDERFIRMECPLSHHSFLIQWNGRMGSDWWFGENSRNSESCVTRKDGEV